LVRAGLLNWVFMWASFRVLTLSPLSVKSMQPYSLLLTLLVCGQPIASGLQA